MKFWKVTVFNSLIRCDEKFGVACDDNYELNRVREIILAVHPEYKSITIVKDRKPKDWMWSEK